MVADFFCDEVLSQAELHELVSFVSSPHDGLQRINMKVSFYQLQLLNVTAFISKHLSQNLCRLFVNRHTFQEQMLD